MDPASVDIITALITLLGLGGMGGFGFLLVRRARRARQRQIDAAGEARPSISKKRKTSLDVEEPEPEPEALPESKASATLAEAEPVRLAKAEPAPLVRPAPRPQPTPEPAHVVRAPVDKPAGPAAAPRKQRDAAALAPGLARTKSGFIGRLAQVFSGRKQIDAGLVEEIEKVLLSADIGVATARRLLEEIRTSLSKQELSSPEAVWALLRRRCAEILSVAAPPIDFTAARPFVLLIIGVNGSGKTTTIGKLAAKLREAGKSVVLAAGDTFRAAAVEQLEVWGSRVGVPVVRGKEGADPSSVLFDAVKRGKTDGADVVIADTAGRLHTKTDLMEELQKVRRVMGKAQEGAPHETWLVIDSTNGQNAIAQAQIFTQAMAVTGIVLTKLDGTAKGGVILGIAEELKLPVRYIGVGERVDDLREFDAEEFVEALFENAAATSPV